MSDALVIKLPVGPTPSAATSTRLAARRKHELSQLRETNALMREARRRRAERLRKLTEYARRRAAGFATGVGEQVTDALGLRGPLAMARGARTLSNPYSLLGLLAIAIAGTAVRLGTGRSWENLGNNLRSLIFGDLTSDAIAAHGAREQLLGNERFARIVGMEGQANSQIRRVFQDVMRVRKMDALGRELLENDPTMQQNSTMDNLILRGEKLIAEGFKASGADTSISEIRYWLSQQGVTRAAR